MKKIFMFLLVVAVLSFSGNAMAVVGTCTEATDWSDSGNKLVVTFTCTAGTVGDAGAYPTAAISTRTTKVLKDRDFYLFKVLTNPGAVPPNAWGFTLIDGEGLDVLGGAGAARHATNSTMFAPLIATGSNFPQPVLDAWTLTITGNTTASAVVVVKLIFVR